MKIYLKGVKFFFLIWIFIFITSYLWSDVSDVIFQKVKKLYGEKNYPEAIKLMRQVISYAPEREEHWEFYDSLVIEFEKYKEKTKDLILKPEFDIHLKEVKTEKIGRFKKAYLKLEGDVINKSDLDFKKVRVKLLLFSRGKLIATYGYLIEDFSRKTLRNFYFNKLVPAFSDYKVEVEVEK